MNKRGAIAVILIIISLASIMTFVKAQTATQNLCIIQQGCSCAMDNSCRSDDRQRCESVKQDCIKSSPSETIPQKTEKISYDVLLIKNADYFKQILTLSPSLVERLIIQGVIPSGPSPETNPSRADKELTANLELTAEAAAKKIDSAATEVAKKSLGQKVTVECTYTGDKDKEIRDGTTGKCTSDAEIAWDIGAPLCNYPVYIEVSVPKNQPEKAILTKCRVPQGSQGPLDCGFTFESCESGEILSGSFAAIFSNSDSGRLPNLDWTRILYLSISVGIIATILILNKKSSYARRQRPRKQSNLHHFLDSNKYMKSLGVK